MLIDRWKSRLIGREETANPSLPFQALKFAANALDNDFTGDGHDVWPDLSLLNDSSHITTAFRRIRTIALTYESPFLKETYHNEAVFSILLACLTRMKHYYRNDMELFGNWWDFDIGAPHAILDTLVLLSHELLPEHTIIDHYTEAVHTFIPVPQWAQRPNLSPLKMTGANLADTALACALGAALKHDEDGLRQVQQAMADLLPFVTEDDGFYEDGSYIQHHHIPYAGGYGPCLLDSFENITYLLHHTPYSITQLPEFHHTACWILDSFLPFIRDGEMMDMVRGRKTSRSQEKAHDTGRMVMSTLLLLADYQEQSVKEQIRQTIKGELRRNTYEKDRLFECLRPCQIEAIQSLLNNPSIRPCPQKEFTKVYGNMDRIVIHRQKYAVGISMFSNRTGRFSFGNGENKKGFHACEGAVYLYTDDAGQYDDNYWPTADMMRLPGITTDHTATELIPWKDNRNSRTWAGGSCLLDRYCSAGMELELELPDSDLTGKKSWFAFEHGIVCLGAGITGTSGDFAETIVENRKIENANVFIDGARKNLKEGKLYEATPGHMVLESRYLPIAYYFLNGETVTIKKERRSGSWNDLNDSGSADIVSNCFFTAAISHQSRPTDASYSYVLAPGLDHYSAKKLPGEWRILSNTSAIQAAAEISTGLTGINFWQPGTFDHLTVDAPCSLIMKQEGNAISLGIADPTRQTSVIHLSLAGARAVGGLSDCVRAVTDADGTTLMITAQHAHGKTHFATFWL